MNLYAEEVEKRQILEHMLERRVTELEAELTRLRNEIKELREKELPAEHTGNCGGACNGC